MKLEQRVLVNKPINSALKQPSIAPFWGRCGSYVNQSGFVPLLTMVRSYVSAFGCFRIAFLETLVSRKVNAAGLSELPQNM
jgi:hypothetical protein